MLLDALIGWADVGRTGWTRSATNGMIWELTANVENVASRWDHGSRMRRKKIWPGAEKRWAEWEDGDRSWYDWDYVSTSERLWRHQKKYFLRWWLNPIHSNSPTSWSDVWFHEHGPMKHSSELSPPTTDLDGSLQSEPYRWTGLTAQIHLSAKQKWVSETRRSRPIEGVKKQPSDAIIQ